MTKNLKEELKIKLIINTADKITNRTIVNGAYEKVAPHKRTKYEIIQRDDGTFDVIKKRIADQKILKETHDNHKTRLEAAEHIRFIALADIQMQKWILSQT